MEMQWYNEPASFEQDGNSVVVMTRPKHDFWRHTLHNFVKDDGHFYYQPVSGDFLASVKVIGHYKDQYDQAGLMVRVDETTWLKCGIELLDGVQQASAVVTRDFSDWSVVALNNNPEAIWIQVKRTGSALEVFYSLDGQSFSLIRQAYLATAATVDVGLMTCSPTGDGFQVRFEDFSVSSAS